MIKACLPSLNLENTKIIPNFEDDEKVKAGKKKNEEKNDGETLDI